MSWTREQLADAPVEIIDGDRGKNYPGQNELLEEGHCLFLSATNVTKDGFAFDKCQFITEQKDNALRKGRVRRNDVVLTTRGTLGNVAYYSDAVPFEHVRINSGMVTIKTKPDKLRSRYLYYFLKSDLFQAQVRSLQSGAAQPQLPIRDIKKIKISYPDPTEQDRIAETVGAYDDLIENNRRRIALLEEAARLLYREWFVHFRFPGHEHVKITDGVPEGWNEGTIDDLFQTSSGGTPSRKKPEYYGGSINWLKTQELKSGFIFETDEKITEEGLKGSSAKLFPTNTVIVAMYGATIGQLCILANPSATNQACCALLPKLNEQDYLFGYSLLAFSANALKDRGQGSAQNNISQQVIKFFEILIPARDLITGFNQLVEPMFAQRRLLEMQTAQLAKARDLLLARLMDGRLEV